MKLEFNKRKAVFLGSILAIALLGIGYLSAIKSFKADVPNILNDGLRASVIGTEIEEQSGWVTQCRNMIDFEGGINGARTPVDCFGKIGKGSTTGFARSGGNGKSLRIRGDQSLEYRLTKEITSLIPGNKYRIYYHTNIKDRGCFDISGNTHYSDGLKSTMKVSRSSTESLEYWCGQLSSYISPSYRSSTVENWVPLSRAEWHDAGVVRNKSRDWFLTETQFTATQPKVDFQIRLSGFDGYVYIDDLTVEEINSFVSDNEMREPINTAKFSFDSTTTPQSGDITLPYTIKTNAAEFKIGKDSNHSWIESYAKNPNDNNQHQFLGKFYFKGDNDFLDGLVGDTQSNGLLFLSNSNVKISIGADSTVIIKLIEQPAGTIKMKGPQPANLANNTESYFYKDGVTFVRYGDNGIYFSPILGDSDYLNYTESNGTKTLRPIIVDESNRQPLVPVLPASELAGNAAITPNPDFIPYLSNSNLYQQWGYEYTVKAGDVFLLSAFPPKTFDKTELCNFRTDRLSPAPNKLIVPDANQSPSQTPELYAQNASLFSNYYSDMVVWHGEYDRPSDSQLRFNNSNGDSQSISDFVKYFIPGVSNWNSSNYGSMEMYDIEGPFKPSVLPLSTNQTSDGLKSYLSQLNSYGLGGILYTTPAFYYSQIPDDFISNISTIVQDYGPNIDGLYFDGYYKKNPVRNLVLMRRLRDTLTDSKKIIVHNSGNGWFEGARTDISDSAFRLPFLDAYADMIWTGETQMEGQDRMFLNNYSGTNISNTPTVLLPEYRTADGTEGGTEITPSMQSEKQIANGGQIRTGSGKLNPNPFDASYRMSDGGVGYFNANSFNAGFNEMCSNPTPATSAYWMDYKNNLNFVTSMTDLQEDGSNLSANGSDVANWLIDDQPLFKLHYKLDKDPSTEANFKVIYDSSPNKYDPAYGYIGPFVTENTNAESFPKAKMDQLGDSTNMLKLPIFDKSAGAYYFTGNASYISGDTTVKPGTRSIVSFLSSKDDQSNNPVISFSAFARVKNDWHRNDGTTRTIFSLGDKNGKNITLELNDGKPGQPDKVIAKFDTLTVEKQFVNGSGLSPLSDGKWHKIGLTFGNNHLNLYIDGSAYDGQTGSGPSVNSLFSSSVGSFFRCDDKLCVERTEQGLDKGKHLYNPFTGWISDYFISDKVLTDTEIQALEGTASDGSDYLKKMPSSEYPKAVIIDSFKTYKILNLGLAL